MPMPTMPAMPTMPKMKMPDLSKVNVKSWIADPFPFVLAWFTGAVLAIFIPVIHWNKKKQEYYEYIGYSIEYEQAQRAYEEANNDNNNDNNNNNQNYYTSDCSWWQYQCKKKAYAMQQYYNNQNGDNNGSGDDVEMPNWYLFLGGTTEEQRRQDEENGLYNTTPGALKFVYAWTLIMFATLVLYGAAVLVKRKDSRVVVFGFLLLAQFAVLLLLLMPQGVIQTDNRELEDNIYGWHGQLGVLLVYTAFGLLLYCTIATLALVVRLILEHKRQRQEAQQEQENADEQGNYKEYEEPKITIS